MNTTKSTTVVKLSESDEIRFCELLRRSYRKVYETGYRLAGNRQDAEDLTQDAFCRAYRSFGDYEGDRPFENWILRIVTRRYLDLLRNRSRRVTTVSYDAPLPREGGGEGVSFEVPDYAPTPEEALVESVYSEEMTRALNSLSAEERLLVTLADVEGISYREIAEMMGRPVPTIRSRLHRTHKRLRDRLERLYRSQNRIHGATVRSV